MAKTLINHDKVTGIKTYHDYDHSSDKTIISQGQDVEAILKRNKTLQNDTNYKRQGIKNDYYHFASVPMNVLVEIMTKHNIDPLRNEQDLPKLERILSSNEYRYLRTVDKI